MLDTNTILIVIVYVLSFENQNLNIWNALVHFGSSEITVSCLWMRFGYSNNRAHCKIVNKSFFPPKCRPVHLNTTEIAGNKKKKNFMVRAFHLRSRVSLAEKPATWRSACVVGVWVCVVRVCVVWVCEHEAHPAVQLETTHCRKRNSANNSKKATACWGACVCVCVDILASN